MVGSKCFYNNKYTLYKNIRTQFVVKGSERKKKQQHNVMPSMESLRKQFVVTIKLEIILKKKKLKKNCDS